MIVEVRKAPLCPSYMVQVGEDMYEMNEYANQPNGVCIYVGEAISVRDTFKNGDYALVTQIPIGMVSQIAKIAEENGKNMIREMWEQDMDIHPADCFFTTERKQNE